MKPAFIHDMTMSYLKLSYVPIFPEKIMQNFDVTPFTYTEPQDAPNFVTDFGLRWALVDLRGLNAQRGMRFARDL